MSANNHWRGKHSSQPPEDASSINFTNLVRAFGLTQRVDEPMHDLGGIGDVVVSRDCTPLSKITVLDVGHSDHRLIQWHLDLEPPPPIYETTVDARGSI